MPRPRFRARRPAVPFEEDVRRALLAVLGETRSGVVTELEAGVLAIRRHYAGQAARVLSRRVVHAGEKAAVRRLMDAASELSAALDAFPVSMRAEVGEPALAALHDALGQAGGAVKRAFTGWGAGPAHRPGSLSDEARMVAMFTAQLLDQVSPQLVAMSSNSPCARALEIVFAAMGEPEIEDLRNVLRRVVPRARAVNAARARGEWFGPVIQPQHRSE